MSPLRRASTGVSWRQQVDDRLVEPHRLFRDPVQHVQEVLLSEDCIFACLETAALQIVDPVRAQANQRLEFDLPAACAGPAEVIGEVALDGPVMGRDRTGVSINCRALSR